MDYGKGSNSSSSSSAARPVDLLSAWLSDRLALGDVPRVSDVVRHAQATWPGMPVKVIRQVVRTHPAFLQTLHQQKPPLSSRKRRPILATTLGYLHGDILFFSVNAHYETPVTFRSGVLIFCDIVSHYVYLEVLRKHRRASEIIHAIKRVLAKHVAAGKDYPVRGISFDQERSLLSNDVQSFLADQNIKFTAFKFSNSKSKMAENSIQRVRSVMASLEQAYNYSKPWWQLLGQVEATLNRRPIIVEGKRLGNFTPDSINSKNVRQFLDLLHKAEPSLYFGQFNLDDSKYSYKFDIGTRVKIKLSVISSAVLGIKRSAQHLSDENFIIRHRQLYVCKDLTVGELYTCQLEDSKVVQHFDRDDLVPTTAYDGADAKA